MQLANFTEGYYHSGMDGGMSWLGFLLSFLVLAAIIGVVIYLIRTLADHYRSTNPGARDPLDIARERYAKGEITKEQLAEIKKELADKPK